MVTIGKSSTVETIVAAVSVILILLMAMDFFISGGLEEVSVLRKYITGVGPIILPLAVASLIQNYSRRVISRSIGWQYSLLTLVVFFVTLIIGLTLPGRETNPSYVEWYNVIIVAGKQATAGLVAFIIASGLIRSFRIRSAFTAWIAFVCVTALVTLAPIADTVLPVWSAFGRWMNMYPMTAWDQTSFWPQWIAMTVVFINILLLREKMKPA